MVTIQSINRTGVKSKFASGLALLISVFPVSQLAAQSLDAAVNAQTQTDAAAAASQESINAMVDRTQDAANRYAQALAELDSLNQYNAQLQRQVDAQQTEMESISRQLTEIETTNREVLPLMERMVDLLDKFVAADSPFFMEERRGRVDTLKDLMSRADVAISEKYRRILEAYQIELEYGRTLDAYEGTMGEGATARTVQFVRLGRISLMYRTLDGNETGYWDAQQKNFVQDNSYRDVVREALGVARKEGAPDLIRVPVPAPTEVRS
jgi:hypothetical protein